MPRGADLTFDVDSVRFDRALRSFVEELGWDSEKAVKENTRLLILQIIKFTPPKTYSQGIKAVERDINRAMTVLDPDKWRSPKIRDIIRRKDLNALREMVRRIPAISDYKVENFDPQRLHESKRDRRGRIQRSKKVFVVDKAGHKAYVKHKKGNVGSAKAGWYPGLVASGGTAPNFIAKHSSNFGDADVNDLRDKRNPRIRVRNFSVAAQSLNAQNHTVNSAVRMRARVMENNVKHLIEKAANHAGLPHH